jgi:hypothetical protein
MVLLGYKAQVEACFGLFGDSANLDARYVHVLRRMYHKLRNHFGCTRWNNKVMWVMWNLISVYLETVLVSVQDRCTVWAMCIIGSEIVLDAYDSTPTYEAQVEARFGPFGGSANLDAR